MHYYSHHIGDLIRDTANLNDHQLATYMRMIWEYYSAEKPITGDMEDVAFAMRSDEKTIRLLLRHYFVECEDGWRHTRCDREIALFHEKAEKASQSAKARWSNKQPQKMQDECDGNANASASDASARVLDANQEPRTKNQEPRKFKNKKSITRPLDVDEQIWLDWLVHRQNKKASVTQTVLNILKKEADLAGLTLQAVLEI